MKVFVFDLLAYGEQLDHLKVGNELPYPLSSRHFEAGRRGAHLRGTPRRLGGDRPPRLRRRRLQRAPLLALRPDELAQPDGRVGRAAHQAGEAADLRQPAAAARAAAPGRRTGDARLPVERPADLRLRPRHSARIPGAQRCRCRNRAPASRKPTTSSPAPGPRTSSPTKANSGRIATSRCGRARCSGRIRRSGCRSSAARSRSSSPRATTSAITPGSARPAACRTTSSATTPNAWRRAGTPSRPIICRSASRSMSPTARRRRCRNAVHTSLYFNRTLFSHGNITETSVQRQFGYISDASTDYVRPENLRAAANCAREFRNMTMEQLARMAERLPWGTPQEVAERIIALADHRCQHGADGLQSRRHAAGDVPRTDRPLRPRRAADRAGAPGHQRARRRGGDGVRRRGCRSRHSRGCGASTVR